MKVVLANKIGPCFGVERAFKVALQAAKTPGPLTALGALVHHPEGIRRLEQAGIRTVRKLEEIEEGRVIISAHGVPPATIKQAKERGLDVVDATCPLVYLIHRTAREFHASGRQVIILGDKEHREVRGIAGCIPHPVVIKGPQDVSALPDYQKVGLVSQSTKRAETLAATTAALRKRYRDVAVAEYTICRPVRDRQLAIRDLAPLTDLIVIVGGKNSANTREMVQAAQEHGARVVHVEGAHELDPESFRGARTVGLAGGASTPLETIHEVAHALEAMPPQA
ncbi:MAG: 4-hydroxy-3-methylbut-2-enyl diphosphate reductase [Deinococcus sp.]|nr:4-hydroxy-3-methylbut-2-enyl diphosphate reductase [Deinococcus sp.]